MPHISTTACSPSSSILLQPYVAVNGVAKSACSSLKRPLAMPNGASVHNSPRILSSTSLPWIPPCYNTSSRRCIGPLPPHPDPRRRWRLHPSRRPLRRQPRASSSTTPCSLTSSRTSRPRCSWGCGPAIAPLCSPRGSSARTSRDTTSARRPSPNRRRPYPIHPMRPFCILCTCCRITKSESKWGF
jgi:hypothetical protein